MNDALDDVPDLREAGRIAEELRPRLQTFAQSDARCRLAGAQECRHATEFLADLSAFGGERGPFPSVRGVIDFLYRDSLGWHVLAIDLGTTDADDPWRGRRPGLVLGAWAVSQALGAWPVSIELFDLATNQSVDGDPQKVKAETVASHFREAWAAAKVR